MSWTLIAVLAGLFPCANPAQDFLHTQGNDIVAPSGDVVPMRGINLGGWLMLEPWIPGMALPWEDHLGRLAVEAGIEREFREALQATGKFDDDTMTFPGYLDKLREQLAGKAPEDKAKAFWDKVGQEPPIQDAASLDRAWRQRFGDAGARELWDAYLSTWMTEADFKRAKETGFDFVRLPFWYRWFEDDDKPYQYKDYGFQWLDKAIGWARANGLYVMLDFHGAVGGQSPWDHTGELSRNEFFKNDEFQKRTYALWKAVADRYKDEPAVFAYDCLNEPYSAKDLSDWSRIHDGIYKAIRSVDARHIVVMEDGYKLEDPVYAAKGFFPPPKDLGWENVVYSFHFYQTGAYKEHKERVQAIVTMARREQRRCEVPLYIGEFNPINDDADSLRAMGLYCRTFTREGWSWSPWTLKYTGGKEKLLWGVYQYDGIWDTPDNYRDSKETLLEKIGRLRADHYVPRKEYAEVLRKVLAAPSRPARR